MKLKKEFGLEYEASVKKVDGNDWYPVVAFEVVNTKGARRTREFLRKSGAADQSEKFMINDTVFVSFEDGVDAEDGDEIVTVTFGVKTEPAVAFYGYRQARVYSPLFRLQPSSGEESLECWKVWKDMCERRGFRPDNHTAMMFGQLAIAYSDGRLSISDKWEEGLW